ncbi:breast cancer anti-estrogen resistance protein 3 homolog [Mustelus asterias]
MNSGKDPLTKELEEELKLSSDDLCSHAWFHGPIPRQATEALIERDGDFLIRESRSSPGDYVLSCTWKHEPLHFKIIRVVLRRKESYTRVLFQFEQESFDNLPALVRFYVGNRKPISEDSGAIIFHPINRTVPLRCIEEKYRGASGQRPHDKQLAARNPDQNKRFSLNLSDGVSLDQLAADGNLLRNKDKSGSHPNILDYENDKKPLQSAQSDSYLSGVSPEAVWINGNKYIPIVPLTFRKIPRCFLRNLKVARSYLIPSLVSKPNIRQSLVLECEQIKSHFSRSALCGIDVCQPR